MASWSVSKFFKAVAAEDFQQAVTALQDSLQKRSKAPLFLEIALYRQARPDLSHMGIDRDSGMPVTRMNPMQEFRFASDPGEITPELWRQADYVQAVLRPIDGSGITARVEAKGLQPRQMTFSAGPDNPGEAVKEESLGCYRYWLKGDGVDSNALVYGL